MQLNLLTLPRDKLLLALAITLIVISALSSLAAFHFYLLSLHELPVPTGSLGDLDGSTGNIISFEGSIDIETMIDQVVEVANATLRNPS